VRRVGRIEARETEQGPAVNTRIPVSRDTDAQLECRAKSCCT
jgi:hypothetical protein